MERIENTNITNYTETEFHNAVNKYIKTLNLIPGITPVLSTILIPSIHGGGCTFSLVYPHISYSERKSRYISIPLKVNYVYKDGVVIITSKPEEVVTQNDVDKLYSKSKDYLGTEMFNKISELGIESMIKDAYPKTHINARVSKYQITVIINGKVSISINSEGLQHMNNTSDLIAEINDRLEKSKLDY